MRSGRGDLWPGPEKLSGSRVAVIRSSGEFAVSPRNHCQNRSATSSCRPRPECGHSRRRLCDCRAEGARQSNGEFGELADLAVDTDRATMLSGHDVVADGKAEARTFAGRLGGEERLEELVFDFRRNANAVGRPSRYIAL